MKQKFIIPGKLPGLNEYTAAQRANRHIGAKMKKENTELISYLCHGIKPYKVPVIITFLWVEANERRDPDNFTSMGRKVILDGLVKAGKIPDDSQKWIKGWVDSWRVEKTNPHILIEITDEIER